MRRIGGLITEGPAGRFFATVISTLLGAGLGLWTVSPRFPLHRPSLVDDWSAIARSGQQLSDFGQIVSRAGQRFRPGWEAWNYVQWHTLGAPSQMLGPNIWGVGRLILLVAGIAAVTALVIGVARGGTFGLEMAALVALPPLIVVAIPTFGVDLARLGPQEPVLVGAMMLGGALLFLGALGVARRQSGIRSGGLIGIGYVLWVVGVYQKEVSVAVVVLVPFLLQGRWTALRVEIRRLTTWGRVALAALGVAVVLPLAHVAIEVVRITQQGDLVYGATLGSGATSKFVRSLTRMTEIIGSPLGWILLSAVSVGIATSVVRRKPDWLLIGLLVTALVMLGWSAQTDVFVSRYYMPTIALLAVGFARALLLAPVRLAWVTVALTILTVGLSARDGHHRVQRWAVAEHRGGDLVDRVAALQTAGCTVVTTGVDTERSISLPVLVRLAHVRAEPCSDKAAFVVVGSFGADPAVVRACQRARILDTFYLANDRVDLVGCTSLRGSQQ